MHVLYILEDIFKTFIRNICFNKLQKEKLLLSYGQKWTGLHSQDEVTSHSYMSYGKRLDFTWCSDALETSSLFHRVHSSFNCLFPNFCASILISTDVYTGQDCDVSFALYPCNCVSLSLFFWVKQFHVVGLLPKQVTRTAVLWLNTTFDTDWSWCFCNATKTEALPHNSEISL